MKSFLVFIGIFVIVVGIFYFIYESKKSKKSKKINKNLEKFKNLDKCERTPYSKQYAEKILKSLTDDINKVHPIGEYHLSFHPLECCTLEDSATEDKKKVYICVKDKNGKYYSYNKLLQVAST